MISDELAFQEFVNANNSFTPIVYKELTKVHKENFLTSPLSAEIVLAFVHSGCKGDTAEELRNVLRLIDGKEKIEAGVKSFLPKLKGGEDYVLHTANKMYVVHKFNLKDEFKRVATEIDQSDVETIDFTKNEEAARTMNKWVEERTNSKIQNLINSGNLNENTRAIIINALYFKADWDIKFLLANTSPSYFYLNADEVVEVDMMCQYNLFKHAFDFCQSEELNANFLRLPFKGSEASMVIVLPNEREGLAALENQIENVFAPCDFRREYVNIELPKFKISSDINFKKLLQNLGVDKAFAEKEADLSGIAGEQGDLLIDEVVQKTFIDVNEEGVEAAAATYVAVRIPECGLEGPPVYNFYADHPFIFYISIKGAIAFAGRITNPLL